MQDRIGEIGRASRPTDAVLQIPEAGPARSAHAQYRSLYRRIALTDMASIGACLLMAHWITW